MKRIRQRIDPAELELKDTVVAISRVTKVVKGGKNLSFSALVVVGDGHGVVGFGVGKAKEVPSAIKKGIEAAKKNLIRVPLKGKQVQFALGYSHPIIFDIPNGIDIAVDKQTHITVTGADRQLVGQVAANIRRMRKPDPYKQKGVRYTGEVLKKKVGKTGAK